MPEYFLILLFLAVFSITLHLKYKLQLFRSKRHRYVFFTITFVVGMIWDSLAITRGHWSFGADYLLGIKGGILPLEEYFFFIIFPYALLVLYKLTDKKLAHL